MNKMCKNLFEDMQLNPDIYLLDECIPVCKILWDKNIYTCITNQTYDENFYITIKNDSLSKENIDIYNKFNNTKEKEGYLYITTNLLGNDGINELISLVDQFKIQDVPYGQAYISLEEFMIKYCRHIYKDENKILYLDEELEKRGMILEDDRVYLSIYHYNKHLNYINSISKKYKKTKD